MLLPIRPQVAARGSRRWLARGHSPCSATSESGKGCRRNSTDVTGCRSWSSRAKRPYTTRGLHRLVATAAKLAGIDKPVSPHWLRHSFATLAAAGGAPPYQLQADLGHARLETSQRYIHWARGAGGERGRPAPHQAPYVGEGRPPDVRCRDASPADRAPAFQAGHAGSIPVSRPRLAPNVTPHAGLGPPKGGLLLFRQALHPSSSLG